MRNDARPIGEGEEKSPIASHESSVEGDRSAGEIDSRQSATHEDEAQIVNRGAEDKEATMPTGDSTLNTKM